MSVTPSPIGGFAGQFFNNNGQPLSGGKIYTYAAGGTTPQATYTSASGATPHSNPIVLDSAGRVPGGEIWLTDGLVYKFVIETSTGGLIGTYDNITGVNSNFVNYTVQEEVITATAGQTVFNLSTINYTPNTNSLSVYIDGVNQYVGDSYLETDSDTVTFTAGLHVGAEVKFTTAVQTTSGAVNAAIVAYDPPFTNGAATNVEDKLAQYISIKDFGAVGDGVADDTAAIQDALDYAGSLTISDPVYPVPNNYGLKGGVKVYLPEGEYIVSATIDVPQNVSLIGAGRNSTLITGTHNGTIIRNYCVPTVGGTYGQPGNVWRDFCINGDTTQANQIGIELLRWDLSLMSNILIQNCGSHGIIISQCLVSRFELIDCENNGDFGIGIRDGYNSSTDPTLNNLPTNACTFDTCHALGNGNVGLSIANYGSGTGVNGCVFTNCVFEYNSRSFAPGVGYNILITGNSYMPNEFNDCWVEDDAVLAHIYVNCSDTSTPVRFSNLHHFGGGSSAYPSRCMIVNSGFVYLNTAFGQGTSYRNISGSISPFRVNTATNAHIWATDLVGNLVTDNKFIEDQTYSSNGLFNYVRMNNFGAVYGYSSHAVPNGEIADEWRKETDTHPFVRIAPTLGVGFGDGTAAPTAYIKGAANVISTSGSTTLFDVGANWDGRHLLLGGYHLWVDGTGVLRIKFGAPTSATDGTVVGTQT